MSSDVEQYRTLSKKSEGLYKEKGSKFFGYAFHVTDLDDVKHRLDEVKKEHHSARHHCYAYRLGNDGSTFRANDDGEPAHSAGDPILGQIDSFELTKVLLVVVRYFGGIKLGVGGLITAYRAAAKEAIETNEIKVRVVTISYSISFSYDRMSDVMRIMKKWNAEMVEHFFEVSCRLTAEVEKADAQSFADDFIDLHDVVIEAL